MWGADIEPLPSDVVMLVKQFMHSDHQRNHLAKL
jgi:hypothetical protein